MLLLAQMEIESLHTSEDQEFVAPPTYESFDGDEDKALTWVADALHAVNKKKDVPTIWGDPIQSLGGQSLRQLWNSGSDADKDTVIQYVAHLK